MRIAANGIELDVDERGPAGGEPLLLIMGLGMQQIAWPDSLLDALAAAGFRVIRFDNRDAGRSTGFDDHGVPNLVAAGLRHALHLPVSAPYTLADLAADTRGLLDALGLPSAHVCGVSMGGMVAQHLAARHPERVRSLTLVMTTAGARHLPQPSARVRMALLSRPAGRDRAAIVAHLEKLMRLIGSPAHPAPPAVLRARLEAAVARAWRPAGTARQMAAVIADGDRTPLLARIGAPTAVFHGADDPLIPAACGRHLARHIAGARLTEVPGMGHDLPDALMPALAAAIVDNAARAPARRGA